MKVFLAKHAGTIVQAAGVGAVVAVLTSAVTTRLASQYLLKPVDEGESKTAEDPDAAEELLAMERTFTGRGAAAASGSAGRAGFTSFERSQVAEQITEHNMFCPTCKPEEIIVPQNVDASGRPTGDVSGTRETATTLPLKLMATMESPTPSRSLATILNVQNVTSGLYSPEDLVMPGVVVLSIERGLVHLRNNKSLEFLSIDAVPAPVAAKPTEEKPADAAKSDREIPGAAEAIKCPSENLCIVERAFLENALNNLPLLAKQARMAPTTTSSGANGFRVLGVRKGSLPELLGLKNADVLLSVNGEALDSLDQAMALFMKLRRASNLSVTFERKGQMMAKEIQIQ